MPRSSWRRRTPAKLDDRAADDLGLHAALDRHRDRRDHVADVVAAAEQRLEAAAGLALAGHLEADPPALAVLEVVRVPGDAGGGSSPLSSTA
jgi:hypothetical protein